MKGDVELWVPSNAGNLLTNSVSVNSTSKTIIRVSEKVICVQFRRRTGFI